MSSTERVASSQEKDKLLEISRKLHEADILGEIFSGLLPEVESYYYDRAALKLFESEIVDYDFSTPAQLRIMLQNMWEYQQNDFMKEFAVVSTIATFHCRQEVQAEPDSAIPAFIYNF